MKFLLKIFLLICVAFTFSSCKKTEETKNYADLKEQIKSEKRFVVGINENSKPFAYYDETTNELVGFDVELIKEISKKIFDTNKIIEFKSLTPSNRIYSLNAKEVDVVISTMTINQERLRVIDFSNPYFMTGQALLVKADANIRSGKDLNGKNIGIVLGTTAANNIKYIASNATIKGFKNYKDAFIELENHNIDAISTDDVILQGIANISSQYKILPERYSTEFYGIAFRKDDFSQSLKNSINEVLAGLEKSGKLIQLEKKYGINYRR